MLHLKTVTFPNPLKSIGQNIFWRSVCPILGALTHFVPWHIASAFPDTFFPLRGSVGDTCCTWTRCVGPPWRLMLMCKERQHSQNGKNKRFREPSRWQSSWRLIATNWSRWHSYPWTLGMNPHLRPKIFQSIWSLLSYIRNLYPMSEGGPRKYPLC